MKDTYIPPTLTVVEFTIEHGFASSYQKMLSFGFDPTDDYDYQEAGNEASSFGTSHWNW